MAEQNDRVHYQLPPSIFYLLLGASGSLGLGGGLTLGPQLETEAINQCFDNARTALEVAAQHGGELQDIRSKLNQHISDSLTRTESDRRWRDQEKLNELQGRELDLLRDQME